MVAARGATRKRSRRNTRSSMPGSAGERAAFAMDDSGRNEQYNALHIANDVNIDTCFIELTRFNHYRRG